MNAPSATGPAAWLVFVLLVISAGGTLAMGQPIASPQSVQAAGQPFRWRGAYLILTRMPTLGLGAWKQTVDCLHEDGANLLILWVGGGFRSRRYPITWRFNAEHANVRRDFVRPLIDYAHTRGIRVLLGFTPFGYDGVNQIPIERPELRATGPDGRPVSEFGIYCWGWNLCPSRPEAQRIMLDYAREMAEDFYPNADGLFLESSDYAVCHCAGCKGHYFEREYEFVRRISEAMWLRKPDAMVVVYPHYFSGAKVPYADAAGARLPFDPRWTLFFTPHSAHVEPALVRQAADSLWWNEAPAWCNVLGIREGARQARASGCSGYVPSLECYTYVPAHAEEGLPWLVGRRQVPFGFGWLKEGACPYRELPMRVVRLAYRAFTRDPDLTMDGFREQLGRVLFGGSATPQLVDDTLAVVAVFATDRSWALQPALTSPGLVRARLTAGQIGTADLARYAEALGHVRQIADRHRSAKGRGEKELGSVAQWIADQWTGENGALLRAGPAAKP